MAEPRLMQHKDGGSICGVVKWKVAMLSNSSSNKWTWED